MPITISLGTFDAEKFWRDEKFAKLPELHDGSTQNIIAAMDELLFPLCGPGDLLLTRFAMSPVFKNYLEDIGFSFIQNTQSLQEKVGGSPVSAETCVFELLAQRSREPYFQELLGAGAVFNPYAVLPHTAGAAGRFGGTQPFPAIESVKKVNSKIYSHELHDRLGLKKYGTIIRTSGELEEAAARLQNPKGILLKDPYGVSGKGNLVVTLPGMLKRIEKHLAAQEAKGGLQTCLLMEPYLDKVLDFSCQLNIDASGRTTILSIQNIYNKELTYVGSMAADTRLVDFLTQRGYFEIIHRLAAEIYHDGYFGDVCVDSMILKNDEIVPVVEINARKSMGFINRHLDRFLSRFGVKGYFVYFSTGFQGPIQFADLLAKMAEAEVLFSPARGYGVIPLSGNTLFINRDLDNGGAPLKTYKGRLYISATASTHEKRRQLVDQTAEILRSLSVTIYK